ncbi:hypothetical protein SAMN05660206_10871 [Sphingobacterium wenxiniae]|uniref:Uncharacterized protein n=1 Tax=Sphingobacterium wenxiniae TaxID=683125 RepID=A0A1I6U9S0_9SPHI|nr:hypothetical protein SAMN05660206_10871 [Sphingobacterium wenxiniae]
MKIKFTISALRDVNEVPSRSYDKRGFYNPDIDAKTKTGASFYWKASIYMI